MKKTLIFLFVIAIVACKQEPKQLKINGLIFGTFYEVTYTDNDNNNYQKQLDSLFNVINKSMSNYQEDSDISKINRNEAVTVDSHFVSVFNASKQLYRETEGVFDPTIGKLVNAWNFGSERLEQKLDSVKIDSLMRFVGYNRMGLVNTTVKKLDGAFLDFNAIAKGYAVDVVGNFLEAKAIENYMINIGGELKAKGINIEKQKAWKVGIENPNFDGTQSYDEIFELKDKAMATSGTYRKFKIDDSGNRYAHIINTKTGYPTKTNILSVSVIADTCMLADGYATALQAMGIEKAKAFLDKHPELSAYFIFENKNQELATLVLNNFPTN